MPGTVCAWQAILASHGFTVEPLRIGKVSWLDHEGDETWDQGNHRDGPTFCFQQPNLASKSH